LHLGAAGGNPSEQAPFLQRKGEAAGVVVVGQGRENLKSGNRPWRSRLCDSEEGTVGGVSLSLLSMESLEKPNGAFFCELRVGTTCVSQCASPEGLSAGEAATGKGGRGLL